jgi:Lar family restriction alleviation protein
MNTTTELKPCPFCGGKGGLKILREPKNSENNYKDMIYFAGQCYGCKAETDYFLSEIAAITAWNRRADDIIDSLF